MSIFYNFILLSSIVFYSICLSADTIREKLLEIKEQFNKGLISKEEYGKKQTEITNDLINNKQSKLLEEKLIELDKGTKLETDNKINTLPEKYGYYENLIYPSDIENKIKNRNPYTVAANEVIFRFVSKKHTLEKYPYKAIEGMAWIEIMYNERLKNRKALKEKDIKWLYDIKESFRNNFGISPTADTQYAINKFWITKLILENSEVILKPINKDFKDRQTIIDTEISKLETIKNNANEENLKKSKEELEKAYNDFNLKIDNLKKSDDGSVKFLDEILFKIKDNYKIFNENKFKEKHVSSLISLMQMYLNDAKNIIPKEKITQFKNNNFLDDAQLSFLKSEELKEIADKEKDTENLLSSLSNLEELDVEIEENIIEIGSYIRGYSAKTGFANFRVLEILGNNTFRGKANVTVWEAEDCYARQLTIPCNRAQRFGGRITTTFKSLPLDNVSEVNEEIKFWETEEYHDNFYRAIRGEMEKDEFDIKFPDGIQVWPDGIKYHTRVISSILEEVTVVTTEPAWADSDSNINNLSNEISENISEAVNENSECDNAKQICALLGEVTVVTTEPAWAD